ncbi:hypothetical protein Aperf_G00000011915 [Anoplocephala perfoliata]
MGDKFISLRSRHFELSTIKEASNFMLIVSQVISMCVSRFLAMRPLLINKVLNVLLEIIDFGDLDGKLECVKAASCCLGALSCSEYSDLSSFSSKVFQLSSRSLDCLSFLTESKDKSAALFNELKKPGELIHSCCDLISHVCGLLSSTRTNWNGLSNSDFMDLIETYKSVFFSLSENKLLHRRDLIAALMNFFCQDAVLLPEILRTHIQICETLIQKQKFRDIILFSEDDEISNCISRKNFRCQVVTFFATAFNRTGVDVLQHYLNSFLHNVPDWPSLSLVISACLQCIDLGQCWREPVISILISVIPGLITDFISSARNFDSNLHDLVGQINLLSDLLASSSSHDLMGNLEARDLKGLLKIFENIATMRDNKTYLLSISLRASMLLLVFLKSKDLDPSDTEFLPTLLKRVLVHGNLYWLEDTPMPNRFAWSECIISSLQTTLNSLSEEEMKDQSILKGLSALSKVAICVSWSPTAKCTRCSRCTTSASLGSRPIAMAVVQRLLSLLNGDLIRQIEVALCAAQHLSWDICRSEEITEFILLVMSWITKVESFAVSMMSDVFIELCTRLLTGNASRWAALHRLIFEHIALELSEPPSENTALFYETLLKIIGGMGCQLATGVKSCDPLAKRFQNTIELDDSFGRRCKRPRKSDVQNGNDSALGISCVNEESNLESVYRDLMKETLVSLCRIGIPNRNLQSIIGEAAIQVEDLSNEFGLKTEALLREARHQISQVVIDHSVPCIIKTLEVVARIFQVEKAVLLKELCASLFTHLVIKGTYECELQIKNLVDQIEGSENEDRTLKIVRLCILPDVLVYIFTNLSEEQRIASLNFLESFFGTSIENVARMNDISRLLHHFVLNLYPHRDEALAGIRWLNNIKLKYRSPKPLNGLLLQQQSLSNHVHTDFELAYVPSGQLSAFLQKNLCGILAFFDSWLIDDTYPLVERRQCLLSLSFFMDLIGGQLVSRTRAKFIATLKLCLRYKFVEPKSVVHLWSMFLKMLERESLIELLPDITANLVNLLPIAPNYVKKALGHIFIHRREQIGDSLKLVFFLPEVSSLMEYQSVIKEACPWLSLCASSDTHPDPRELNQPPPNDLVELLTAWLGGLEHSSRPVRRYTLASLIDTAINNRLDCHRCGRLMQLSRLVVRALKVQRPTAIASSTQEDPPDGSCPLTSIRHLLSRLIACLLTSLIRDSDPDIRLLYSKWLGALGAVDPSRLALIQRAPQNAPASSIEAALNWGRNFTYDVIMELANIYMRAGSPKQLNSTAVALQELLRLFQIPESAANASEDSEVGECLLMGEELWSKFSANIHDLLTPMFSSKYVVEALNNGQSLDLPIFSRDDCPSYDHWLRVWTESLKEYVTDPMMNKLFKFCGPVINSDSEFARYILDPIALQVIIGGNQNGTTKMHMEILSLLETVAESRRSDRYTDKLPTDFLFFNDNPAVTTSSAIVKPSWKSWYPLAAQTIFSLLDFLNAWHRSRSADYAVVVAALAKGSDRRSDSGFKATEDQKSRLLKLHMGLLLHVELKVVVLISAFSLRSAVTRMSDFLNTLSHSIRARASRQIGGLARALRNWEFAFAADEIARKAFYVTGFIDRLEAPQGPLIGEGAKESLIGMIETLSSLHDTDGVMGVLTQMQHSGIHPSPKAIISLTKTDALRSCLLRALQLENEDSLEMACATYEHSIASTEPQKARGWGLHAALFRCYLPDPASLPSLITRSDFLLSTARSQRLSCGSAVENAAWFRQLNEIRAEAAIRMGNWEELDKVMASESSEASWSLGLGKVFLSIKKCPSETQRNNYLTDFMNDLRQSQMAILATSALEGASGYLRASEPLVNLSLLTDIEEILEVSDQLAKEVTAINELGLPQTQKNSELLISNMLSWLDARVQHAKPTYHTLEPVLAMRHSALELIASRLQPVVCSTATSLADQLKAHQIQLLESAIGDSWLHRARLARRAGQFTTAYTCVLKAEARGCVGAMIEYAKLLWQGNKREAALDSLNKGLNALAATSTNSEEPSQNLAQSLTMPSPNSKSHKALEPSFVLQALLLHARYCVETSHLDFDKTRHLYTDICEAFPGCEKAHFRLAHYVDEAHSKSGNQHDILLKIALENYSKALASGSQYIFQSMPRFLSLWLDYGSEVAKIQQRQLEPIAHATALSRRANSLKPAEVNMINTFDEVQELVRKSIDKIPKYQFYTAIGQILSRVCHEHQAVITLLVDLIVQIVNEYPQQTVWFVISLHEATVSQRHERFLQICSKINGLNAKRYRFLKQFIGLCGHLRAISDLFLTAERRDVKSFKLSRVIRSFTRLLETCDFSDVLIPIHRQLVPSLLRPGATLAEVQEHQPFGVESRFVKLVRIEDDVEVLGSQTRPKKMCWLGSDGRKYAIVAKPNDDMRKDSRLMDMNSIINRFLLKNSQTRHRGLGIRTYAVIPLREHGGLIEWVSNTQPFRNILITLYAEEGRPLNWVSMNRYAPLLEDSLQVKRDKFLNKLLPMYPLVFYRWFINIFPNPSEWYEARETFVRTCAVMSMVGYVLGLGDRHTENILFDCTTGGLVHVDFSCVFNTGLTLPWPERVPFRLTRSLVHAMGPTGYEGTFRRCAEVTMRLLRREIDPLMAVFRPLYFDSLVEKSSDSNAKDDARKGRKGSHPEGAPTESKLTRAAIEKLSGMEDRLRGKITEHDEFSKLLPISVEGQVDVLIKEATSVDLLCQMYKGWMPFL